MHAVILGQAYELIPGPYFKALRTSHPSYPMSPTPEHRKQLYISKSYRLHKTSLSRSAKINRKSITDTMPSEEKEHETANTIENTFDFTKMARIVEFIDKHLAKESQETKAALTKGKMPRSAIRVSLDGTVNIPQNISGNLQEGPDTRSEGSPLSAAKIRIRQQKVKDAHLAVQNQDYLYFLKKVCQVTRKDALRYTVSQQKRLSERSAINAATELPPSQYTHTRTVNELTIYTEDSTGKKEAVVLQRMFLINDIRSAKEKDVEFEYIIYKYNDSFAKISQASGLDRESAILEYYLNVPNVWNPSKGLLSLIAKRDWPDGDRILFEENFRRHGKKFWKYQMPRTESDIRMYALYYMQNMMIIGWSDEERGVFAKHFLQFKKSWAKYKEVLPDKNINDVKRYYNEYFQKLNEEEQAKELFLMEASVDNE